MAKVNKRRPVPAQALADLYGICGRFRRSVHIERDELSTDALDGYRITPIALKTLERIFTGIEGDAGTRAWSLTGPYGSGKSSFAMFLAALFAPDDEGSGKNARLSARKLLKAASEPHARQLLGETGRRSLPGLCSVLITGERLPLSKLLLRGLAAGLLRIWSGRRQSKALKQILARAQAEAVPSTRVVVQTFEDAITLITSNEQGIAKGLLVVLDEAGKALEHAAHSPAESDVLLLQELAELAARSGDKPFVFITVFHQAFSGYAARLGPTQRNEWEKVQGRFEDIAFVDGWDQSLRLIADAIETRDPDSKTSRQAYKHIGDALTSVDLPAVLEPNRTEALLRECLPLHPYVALLLGPLFRTGVFQNERSLFAFLASQEPGGLQEFLIGTTATATLPLYPLDRLYDYIESVLQSRATFSRAHALRTTEVALQRVPDTAGKLGAALVKNIALLSWIGEKVGLRADEVTLKASVAALAEPEQVDVCLKALVDASVITFRRFRSSYVVWEGSDIRIDEVLANAGHTRLTNERAVALLEALSPLDPIVARRHLFETGTLRYFPVKFVAAERLPDELDKPDDTLGDGNVLLVIFQSETQRKAIVETLEDELRLETASPRPILCVVPRDPWPLHELLGEYAALEQLVRDDPRLPHDPVAKTEIQARKLDLETLIHVEVGRLVGLDQGGSTSTWHHDSKQFEVTTARQLSALVSQICDRTFAHAPRIHNELINRHELSSAAASARRSLLAAMLTRSSEAEFGIEGYPPEKSMYLSLFQEQKLHTKGPRAAEVQGWILKEPPKLKKTTPLGAVSHAWHAMREFLGAKSEHRLPLEHLYTLLESPPFGIKRGVTPVLIAHFLVVNAATLALYENEAFLPKLTEAVIERLLKSPKNFQVQWYPMGGARLDLLQVVGKALNVAPRAGMDAPTVLQIVKRLMRATSELPRYAQLTRRLSSPALKVRDALFQAKEPAPLMFKLLPLALGFESFRSQASKHDNIDAFAQMLTDCVAELDGAYDTLLRDLETELSTQFGMTDLRGAELQRELGQRGSRVFPHAIAPKLKSFLIRAVDEQMPRVEWLVSIGTLLAKKPPEHWIDSDLDVFRTELAQVRRSFLEIEALTLADDAISPETASQRRLFRVAISELGATTRERVVSLSLAEEKSAHSLQDRLQEVLRGFGSELTLDARLAMLSAVTANLIQEAEREAPTDSSVRDHD